jgi:hypothetical protein
LTPANQPDQTDILHVPPFMHPSKMRQFARWPPCNCTSHKQPIGELIRKGTNYSYLSTTSSSNHSRLRLHDGLRRHWEWHEYPLISLPILLEL